MRCQTWRRQIGAGGILAELMVGLLRAGLTTPKAEQSFAAGRAVDVTRVRITEAGRAAHAAVS